MRKAIVVFGAPGSGKGTQAKLLSECLGIPHISTGDVLRERVRTGEGLAAEVVAAMKAGELVPDEVVNHIVEQRLGQPDAAQGFILDGYPRTVHQAERLEQWLGDPAGGPVVICLVVDYNIIISRLAGRRQCPRCRTLYNLVSQPPRVDQICDLDGEALVSRADDSEGVIRERLEAYRRETRPVLEYYRANACPVLEVEAGTGTPDAVFGRICQAMEKNDRSKDRR
jgi:adenylate kinase